MSAREDIDSSEEIGEIWTHEKLSSLLLSYSGGISYNPISAEPSPQDIFPELFSVAKILYTIQPIATLSPLEEFTKAELVLKEKSAFILIPGREFDASGTRHGKGAGWYDRFLSAVPKEWIRVGICYSDQFSSEPLNREAWDEPMDFVCVVDKSTGNSVVYLTHGKS